MLIVVATDIEFKKAKIMFPNSKIIKTGVGGVNVYNKLKNISRFKKILNFGFVGSNSISVGTIVKIKKCKSYHPNVNFKEKEFILSGDVDCYTANDFVLDTKIKEQCVFDMELVYILAMGFKRVESIKIVSDNLNLKKYEEITNE
ncbi:MAG: hypothetical protein EOM78_20405 [Erysipelotrichia bacterium]|nr:hypothetical protein [Erysipelotrichia bacterium]